MTEVTGCVGRLWPSAGPLYKVGVTGRPHPRCWQVRYFDGLHGFQTWNNNYWTMMLQPINPGGNPAIEWTWSPAASWRITLTYGQRGGYGGPYWFSMAMYADVQEGGTLRHFLTTYEYGPLPQMIYPTEGWGADIAMVNKQDWMDGAACNDSLIVWKLPTYPQLPADFCTGLPLYVWPIL